MEYLTTPDSARRWNLPGTTPGTGTAAALIPAANRQAHIRDSFQSLFSPSLDLPAGASGSIAPSPSLLGPRFTAPTPVLPAPVPIVPGGGAPTAPCAPSMMPSGGSTAVVAAGGMDMPPSPARPEAVMSSPFLRQAAKDAVVREFHNTYLADTAGAAGPLRFGLASPAWNVLMPATPGVGRPPPVPTPTSRVPGAGSSSLPGAAGVPKRTAPAQEPGPAAASSPVKEEAGSRPAPAAGKPPAPPSGAPLEQPKVPSSGEGTSTASALDITHLPVNGATSRIPGDGASSEADLKLTVSAPVSMAVPNLPAPYAAMMYGAPGLGMYMPSASMAAQMQHYQQWQQVYQQQASVGMFPAVPSALVPSRAGQFAAPAAAAPVKETQEERKTREESEKETLTREFKKKTREAALLRFRQKRRDRKFGKLVRYTVRKALADGRPRVKGRFVKMPDDMPAESSVAMDSSDSSASAPLISPDAGSLRRRAPPEALAPASSTPGKPPCTPVSSG